MGGWKHGGMGAVSNNAEDKARSMERVVNKLRKAGGLVLFNYYIPVELSVAGIDTATGIRHDVRIDNPAARFRGLAVHLDGSNWLMPADALSDEAIVSFCRQMDRYTDFVGGSGEAPAYWSTPLREEEYRKFIDIADKKFCNHVRQLSASLIDCIANADARLREAMAAPEWATMTPKDRAAKENYRNNCVRSRIKRADEELSAAIECAERFDASERVSDLIDALRAAIRSERTSFNAIARSRGVKVA